MGNGRWKMDDGRGKMEEVRSQMGVMSRE